MFSVQRKIIMVFTILVGSLLVLNVLSPAVQSEPVVELKILGMDWSPFEAFKDREMIPRAYENYTKGAVKIRVESYPWEAYWEKSLLELSTGSPTYDIVFCDIWHPSVVSRGWFYDLTDWPKEQGFEPINWSFLSKTSLMGIELKGKYWGAPLYEGILAIFARQDMLDQSGMVMPRTWDDFLAVVKKFTRDTDGDGEIDFWGTALHAGMGESLWACDFISRLIGQTPPKGDGDGYIFDSKGNPIFQEAGMKALNRMIEVLPYSPPGTLAWSYGEVSGAMRDSRIALTITYGDSSWDFENPELSKVVGKIAYAAIPTDPGLKQPLLDAVIMGGINKASKNAKEAYDFLRWYVNEGKAYEMQFPLCPLVTPDLRMREKHRAEYGHMFKIYEGDLYIPYHLGVTNLLEVIFKISEPLSMCLNGRLSAEQAIEEAVSAVTGIVKQM